MKSLLFFKELNKATLKPFLIRLWGQEDQQEAKSGLSNENDKSIGQKEKNKNIYFTLKMLKTFSEIDFKTEETISSVGQESSETFYHPGKIIKTVEIPTEQKVQNHSEENLEKFKFDVITSF